VREVGLKAEDRLKAEGYRLKAEDRLNLLFEK